MAAIRSDATDESIISALSLAFSSDPVLRWLYSDPGDYLAHFPTILRHFGGGAFSSGTALLEEEGLAAALWLPPGAHPDGEALIAHFEEVLPKTVLEDAYKVFDIMDELHPDEPCWHLAFVGTDPLARRRGHGSALIEHFLPRCDAEGTIAYLENTNPANTGLYERHGFRVIGEMQAGKSPVMLAMLREPRG